MHFNLFIFYSFLRYNRNVGELSNWRNYETFSEVEKAVRQATGKDIEFAPDRADLICQILGEIIYLLEGGLNVKRKAGERLY